MQSPIEAFLNWEEKTPDAIFLRQPKNGVFKTWTWKQAGEEARKLAGAFNQQGLVPGDRIAILSKNCAEWIIADIAIMMGGFISVPLYATITGETIHQILEHSGSKLVIIGKLDDFSAQAAGIPAQVADVHINHYGSRGGFSWDEMIQSGKPIEKPLIPDPDEVFTIMYTSGTTGKPKGVMHSARAFYSTIRATDSVGIPDQPSVFSYLPLSHIAERVGIQMTVFYRGGCFSFSESLESFPRDLQATQPDIFFAVPRIWAKFREKIEEKLPPAKLKKLIGLPIIGWLVKRKVSKGLGLSKAVRIFSGAAPISVEMMQWYQQLGITILQAYGMTEDSIYGHFNLPGANKLGTVGRPLPGANARISPDGEIQVHHDGLMKGYYKEPELTAEMFTSDGFLRTGDIGEIDSQGFLTITGRLKDQFKTDKGKYISPGPIELELLAHHNIDQVCVVGMGIPQPIALTNLSADALARPKQEVEAELSALLSSLNLELQPYEKIEKFVVLPEPWTVENELMTPTLKVKRNVLEKRFVHRYPEWYGKPGKVVWL